MLARAPRTQAELAARLVQIGYSTAKVAETVARCRELGYLNDAALATDRARALRARGAGSLRIVADLEARGVPDALVAGAVDASLDGEREAEWARRSLARLRLDIDAPRARARAWRLLGARGFPEEVILEILGD